MKRNKNMPFVLLSCFILLIFLLVNMISHTTVYFVYSSGIGTFIIFGLIITVIIVLYVKGM
ncbi:hypothetical protein BIV59_14030 [Bacillus sp. MUM 13]|nr:hypothetical protein BIV59_14030 [Bacillus sp. MUM 13]